MARLPEGVIAAVIAASSAIAGTIVGAVVSYEGNRSLQNRQVQQEEARQRTTARAIVRLLMSEYHTDADRLRQMIALREYDPASYREHTFASRLSQEDRKLLAGNLSERDWVDIAEAAQAVELVQSELELHHGRGSIGAAELEELETARTVCRTAYNALVPVAEGKRAS
jgi:hypothetical protein